MDIKLRLEELKDEEYAVFHARLVPNIAKEKIIGVRIPKLRMLAKEMKKEKSDEGFLNALPHEYNEENILHAILISEMKDFDECVAALEKFLPFADNWSVTDAVSPSVFKKNKGALIEKIKEWLAKDEAYTVRMALGLLMRYYLDGDFKDEYLYLAASVRSEEYYVKMMQAWFFATALAKQWNSTLPLLENAELDVWVHNKTVSKACESFRITAEQKAYLKTLKR